MCLSAPDMPAAVAPAKPITPVNTDPTTMETPVSNNDLLTQKLKGKKQLRADVSGLQIPIN